jgi:hypothetical protein
VNRLSPHQARCEWSNDNRASLVIGVTLARLLKTFSSEAARSVTLEAYAVKVR